MLNLLDYQIIDQIYESPNSILYRALRNQDNQPVILKMLKEDYPTSEELTRYRQEYDILQSLAHLDGVINVYSIEKYKNTVFLSLEDFGGDFLRQLLENNQLSLLELLNVFIDVADILGHIHQEHIIHKDINPSNLILNLDKNQLKFIDFGVSTRLSQQHPSLKSPNVLEGTLAYMSPEQTGRMNRSLDYRTDFYSLGITCYELFTGVFPFDTTDPMELIHCHIAKQPQPPAQVNSDIPPALSDIIMKLMAKTAEDRYQSAWGLKADLQTCQARFAQNQLNTFPLGQKDASGRFHIPQKLYGRELEIDNLQNTFERVVHFLPSNSELKKSEIMLIAGYSGIGKTVLVKEIYKSLTLKRGYFISGKFDQFQRNIPYSAIAHAFKELIQQLLTEPSTRLNDWKEKLFRALGSNGQVIIDVIPEMEFIIGPQPAISILNSTESQNRFNTIFTSFLKVFCQPEHPLVIFLDDLQWADSATLKLLQIVIANHDIHHLFLIGAYRDNEVMATHPLMMTLEALDKKNVLIHQIFLKPLAFKHVNQLIAESLHKDELEVKPLTKLVMTKTGGNPFFVNQFLQSLYEENLLVFKWTETRQYSWQWDLKQIQVRDITDNVVDLMIGKLKKLPQSAQQILCLAACVGNHFDLETLSIIYERSDQETYQNLMPILTENFILPLSELEVRGKDISSSQLSIRYFRFLHDRVHQAAYTLIDDDQKPSLHLKIGRILLKNTPSKVLEDRLFNLVEHLNQGLKRVDNPAEKIEIIQLNLRASQKAKLAIAYEPALNYSNTGLTALPTKSWETLYDLTLQLHLTALDIQYAIAQFEQANSLAKVVLQKAINPLDKVLVHEKQISFFHSQNQMQKAIDTGLHALTTLNITLSDSPPQNIDFENCFHLPEMSHPETQMALKILTSMMSASHLVAPELFPVLVYTMVNLSLKYGNAPLSAYAYVLYGVLLCGLLKDIETGYYAGQLALKLLDKFNSKDISFVQEAYDSGIRYWNEHLRYSIESYQEIIQEALEVGNSKTACHNAMHYLVSKFFVGENLNELNQIYDKYLELMLKNKEEWNRTFTLMWAQVISNLQGHVEDKYRLMGSFFNEDKVIPQFIKDNHGFCLFCVYLAKEQLCYLFKYKEFSLEQADLAEKYKNCALGLTFSSIHNFYDSLIRLASCPNINLDKQNECLQQVKTNQTQMKIWAHHAPMNHQHKYDLVEAEKARVLGQIEAIEWYEQAIEGAKTNGYLQEEALAYELAAEFYLSRKMDKLAQTYMKEAHYRYQQWGAQAKVKDLEARYPSFWIQKGVETNFTVTQKMIANSSQTASSWLDINSLMKAAQTLSGEIVLNRLLEKMMRIVIENAGAEKGFLILPKNDQWVVEAEGQLSSKTVNILKSLPIETQNVAQTIIHYVIRCQEMVVLDEATEENQFARDPYILSHCPKSLLCLPLLNQGQLTGLLYLENNLTIGAFTPERVQILQVLSSQLAISIENALLYQTLEQKVEERTAQLAEANQEITLLNEQLKSENLRMSAELDVSRQLQQMLLPQESELSQIEGLDIAGFMRPADEVGGDYYDVLQHQGQILLGIGDVTGHGLQSGVLAIMVQSAVRTLLVHNETDLVKLLATLNEMVYLNGRRMAAHKSMTLSLMYYQKGQLILSGQHEEVILVRANGELELIDTVDLGFPIGLEQNISEWIDHSQMTLNQGDVVVLYTDGITEAINTEGTEYEMDRLCQVVKQKAAGSASQIRQAVIDDVYHFIGQQRLLDDITLLVLKQK